MAQSGAENSVVITVDPFKAELIATYLPVDSTNRCLCRQDVDAQKGQTCYKALRRSSSKGAFCDEEDGEEEGEEEKEAAAEATMTEPKPRQRRSSWAVKGRSKCGQNSQTCHQT